MRWSRIKNIILLLLVTVNVFLLALVGFRAWHTRQGERESRERMIGILAGSGIQFLPEEVPGEMPLTPWRVSVQTPDEARSAALVGELREIRSVGTRTTCLGALGEVSFTSAGEVEATFLPGAWPAEKEQIPTETSRLLAALGVDDARLTERREEGGIVRLTVAQLWEGAPLFDRMMTLTWEDGSFTGLSGRFLMGTGEAAQQGRAISASTALIRFLAALNEGGYVCSQITGVYAGYTSDGASPAELSPAWIIETDVWPRYFAVDAATGAVTAAE